MSEDIKEIKKSLKQILENQGVHGTALAVVETEVKNIHAMGCSSGDERAGQIFSEIKESGEKIRKVDEKHDLRAIAVVGSVLLGVLTYVGSIYVKKIW